MSRWCRSRASPPAQPADAVAARAREYQGRGRPPVRPLSEQARQPQGPRAGRPGRPARRPVSIDLICVSIPVPSVGDPYHLGSAPDVCSPGRRDSGRGVVGCRHRCSFDRQRAVLSRVPGRWICPALQKSPSTGAEPRRLGSLSVASPASSSEPSPLLLDRRGSLLSAAATPRVEWDRVRLGRWSRLVFAAAWRSWLECVRRRL